MRRLTKSILFVCALMVLTLGAFPLAAKIDPITGGEASKLGLQLGNLREYLATIAGVFLTVVAVIAVIVLVYGGVQYIISLGEEKSTEKAKKTIMFAVLGLIIIGLAAVVVNFTLGAINKGEGGGAGGGGAGGGGGIGNF